MKELLTILAVLLISACGSSGGNQEEAISEQEEAKIVESITSDLNEAQETLKKETEEGLSEIDSLLENF